jgi:hypothetical protein
MQADKEEYEARSARELKGPALNRRVRMERPELEQALFALFERQPHWAFMALQKETDQPGGWLREVLSEVALQVGRCAVLCCAVLCCAVLCCAVLFSRLCLPLLPTGAEGGQEGRGSRRHRRCSAHASRAGRCCCLWIWRGAKCMRPASQARCNPAAPRRV